MSKAPVLCIIVAASQNNVIGKKGEIPWHISGDLKYVKARTWGKPIIMGRGTYDSLGRRPLPGRSNIVVTSQDLPEEQAKPGVYIRSDLAAARAEAQTIAAGNGIDEIFIFGGGALYKEALPDVSRIYLTRVDVDVDDGDAFFPALNSDEWREIDRRDVAADPEKGSPSHHYLVLERVLK